ncbi:MAG: membrane protein insertion efficiency factor YidD [Desulfobacteraceae bacterium]|nr:membrane protein insertion efficiency factor YidD [Desulfobacteraceae bacterium]
MRIINKGIYLGRLCAGILLCLVLIAATGCAFKQNALPGPKADTGPVGLIIAVYQEPLDHLNAVRTGQCPMYPSCSHYAQAAAEKHGPVIGTMLACDRLIRCGRGALDYAPKIPVNGKWRYYDPLSANDFWFCGKQ